MRPLLAAFASHITDSIVYYNHPVLYWRSGIILSPKYVQPTIEMGGASYEVVVMSGYSEGIIPKTIEAGETLRGNFVFEVPQGAANDGFTLTFTLDKTKVSGEVA